MILPKNEGQDNNNFLTLNNPTNNSRTLYTPYNHSKIAVEQNNPLP
jgi:hypothetical protein